MPKKCIKNTSSQCDINSSSDNQLLAKQNQELLQKNIRLQECLNNYQQNYKMISYKLLLMSSELQSFKVGADIFAKQHDELKLHFDDLWHKYWELQKQHDYLKDKYIEALRKNNKHDTTTPSSFGSFTSSFTSTSTSGYNLESPELPSQSSNQSFTPGYNSDTLDSMNQSPRQKQNIKGSEERASIIESLRRTKQWLILV